MKYLGIDYGTKKVGIAVSDDAGVLAFPRDVVQTEGIVDTVLAIIQQEKIDEAVIGESVNFDGEHNKVMESITEFIGHLTLRTPIPVHLEKEFLTTAQARNTPNEGMIRGSRARKTKQKTPQADAQAAAIILQTFLDKVNK